ncbi:hypothetical protein DPMN_149427 [Dreissena polymorpha]|uniref:Uncharacterized protein n=1 Tax=Dreissena polymorpha TaxID=45954 RepID=A0A9D4FBQ6_DREPO|nr:hypothetical protein DPMN_149427 [Dreissena polymorpha]
MCNKVMCNFNDPNNKLMRCCAKQDETGDPTRLHARRQHFTAAILTDPVRAKEIKSDYDCQLTKCCHQRSIHCKGLLNLRHLIVLLTRFSEGKNWLLDWRMQAGWLAGGLAGWLAGWRNKLVRALTVVHCQILKSFGTFVHHHWTVCRAK